jgi:hypothetical protein
MRGRWFLRVLKFIAIAIVALAGFSFVTMHLWNWLTPALFGWKLITFWQALGLIVLAKILFGGFRGRGCGGGRWRHRMRERWEQMTPEEREKFRSGMGGRCGFGETPGAKPATQA